ncbi:disease resistance protein (TIR-NBS-LRR class), partial [Trifolium pratense]
IDKLEEDILQMESLTTLIATNSGVKEVPYSILRSKSIAYISLCGYEGLTRDVFPSLIKSWMSPTINSLPGVSPFGGISLSRVSLDIVESNNMGYESPMPNILTKLRSVWVQFHSENQLTQELRRFLDDLYDVNFVELETTSHGPLISNLCLRSLVIGMGSSQIVIDTLGKTLSQVPLYPFTIN